jgi:diaminohydroxyphosphoribosylaminopyrimidine deaminase/5-amino-6-(5-phosphoribosylamino)uracil reductase
LRAAGVEVIVGVESALVRAMDPGYHHHRETGLPRVIMKMAVTLDGQSAAADGTSQWITGEEARADAHRLRAEVDAVMVGAGTLITDDPLLTVRSPDFEGPQPRPVIVAGTRPLPPMAQVFDREPLVLAAAPIRVPSGEVLEVGSAGRVDLRGGLELIAEKGLLDLLVEGGAGLAASLWHEGLVTEGVSYLASRLAGGIGRGAFDHVFSTLEESRQVELTDIRRVGEDLRIDWRPRLD